MNRRNQSIINEEVSFQHGEELISTTDKRGVITYANPAFCRVAGFSLEELVGKNHNIVRHPDMPSAAFKDLWKNLSAGLPWRGVVKNRCKDGRYYWVDAFVTPIFEKGTLIGYQSVRTKLNEETKQNAIKSYQAILAGKSLNKWYESNKIKGLTYWEIAARDHFTQAYHITLEQAINHNNKESKTFKQQMYLSHVNENKPFLMETCGYEAYDNTKEIAKMTQGNQLVIEYRFYGKSKPERADYTYLRNIQAAKDYHHINTEFKKIYTGKWISSGVSKGGANAITYRYLYPEDVNVTIPYVAPITLKREDERTTKHINTIGEESCREKTFQFQKTLLERRDEILPMLKSYSGKYEKSYSIGFDTALEYAAYEYTFSFWQWLGDCDKIPDKNASASELFNHVENTVGWSFYADETIKKLHPCYYQHMVELGYYGFQTKHIANLVKVVKQPDNMFSCRKASFPMERVICY